MRSDARYRWWIVAGCLLVEAMTLGAVNNCFALYTIPVTEGLHISREVFSTGQTLIFLGTMLMNTLVGGVIDRLGITRTMRIAAVVMSLSYCSYALTHHVWQFMAASVLIGLTMPMITAVPISLLIRGWFSDHVGLALGIAFMGSGVGGMFFNPFGSFLIRRFGWRYAYAIVGLMMLAVLCAITFFLIKEPREPFANPRGAESDRAKNVLPGRSIGEEMRTGLFWVMMLLAFCMGAGTYSVINFTSTYLQDSGHTAAYAAGIASVSMGAMAAGKLVVGRMYDRIGVRKSTLTCVAFLLVGMLGFTFISLPFAVPAILLGSAIGCPVGTVASPIIARYVFGDRDFARKVGMSTAFGNLGASITPVLSGHLYEAAGSYRMLYQSMAALMCAAFVIYFFVLNSIHRRKLRK